MSKFWPLCAVEELLLWRDPKKSGIALAGSTVVFLFVQFARFNAISLSAYLLISLILGCFLWNNIASLTHKYVTVIKLYYAACVLLLCSACDA